MEGHVTSPGTIGAQLEATARRFPDQEALVDGELRLTWADLAARVRRSAAAAVAAGVAHGDRVAIWAPNIAEWVIAGLGAVSVGAALVPLNTRFKGPEAAYILAKSRATTLFCVNGFLGNDYVAELDSARAEFDGLPSLRQVIVLRGDAPSGTRSWGDYLAAGDHVDDATVAARAAAVRPDDVSDIIFTSGTTGRPKGVVVTHAQTLKVFTAWAEVVGLRPGDQYLIINPFFHTFGYKAGVVAALIVGATLFPLAVFDVPAVLRLVSTEKISALPGPPTLFQSILDHPDRRAHDLRSLRLVVTGAAAIPVTLIERLRDEMKIATVVTGYGLTESTGTVTMCRHDDDAETIALTSGRAIPDVEVRIVDDHGAEVPTGEPGEIVCRGYNVMQGYFEDPAATAEAIDADGWLHTGDIGVMDARGYVRITDRAKDMYIVGGFNAYPAEIENMLMRFPAVGQVAVVGVPDARMGEVGKAFVVPRPGMTVEPDAVITWARGQMANYKVPRFVEVIDALPLNASGKVLKYELRQRSAPTT